MPFMLACGMEFRGIEAFLAQNLRFRAFLVVFCFLAPLASWLGKLFQLLEKQ